MNNIVCLSTSNWHPFPTRKQHVMSRIKNSKILYFDPPVTYIAPLKDKRCKARLTAYKNAGDKVAENITVYALPPILPFYNKFRFINRINQKKIARFVREKMVENHVEKPIVWCYSPMSADAVDRIPHTHIIYDCVDRHSAYKGLINVKTVNKMEKCLAQGASQVFTTAIGLFDTLQQYNKNTVMLPNGVNFAHFASAARDNLETPEDMRELKRPIVGFAGMLQECIDYDKIEALAKARPDWSVVLIGGHMPSVDVDYLKKYDNIFFLGMKKYEQMPSYLAACDVCLNVFRSGDLARDVSPLKFYEYLATGKPIVSTPQPEQVLGYTDVVYISRGEGDFVEKCELAVSESGTEKRDLRLTYAEACSWEARVRDMEDILKEREIFEND